MKKTHRTPLKPGTQIATTESKVQAMAQIEVPNPATQVTPGQRKSPSELRAQVRSASFKYYIHDGVESCRLQLVGELSVAEVPELSGCWSTARTTLAKRKLLLDLQALHKVDDSGRQWIISMVSEGAILLPETFLRDALGSGASSLTPPGRTGVFARLVAFIRGARNLSAPSSTQAQ